jgi:thioredoxin 1
MKKTLFLLIALGFVLTSFTICQFSSAPVKEKVEEIGINFKSISFADALKLAKKENKIIFIDAYTTWCGPCKMMSSRTFTDVSVGKYFNENFINLKIEMEKDTDGAEIARRYKVQAYPTLLFINGEGKLVHSILGFRNASAFLIETQNGLK